MLGASTFSWPLIFYPVATEMEISGHLWWVLYLRGPSDLTCWYLHASLTTSFGVWTESSDVLLKRWNLRKVVKNSFPRLFSKTACLSSCLLCHSCLILAHWDEDATLGSGPWRGPQDKEPCMKPLARSLWGAEGLRKNYVLQTGKGRLDLFSVSLEINIILPNTLTVIL